MLFDLDGTLLEMDTGAFTAEYLKEVARAVAPVINPVQFVAALMASTGVMIGNRDPRLTNEEVFWADFRTRIGNSLEAVMPLIEDFYANKFRSLSRVTRSPGPYAREAVKVALDRGFRIVLATQPVFPISAVRDRMAWAGVEDLPWEFVTSYEEMHFCKPRPEYYLEIAGRLGLPASECVMVGNDVEEDMPASAAGMKTCLVTDFLVNTNKIDFKPDWSGPISELAGWLAKI
ncbi:MAG: HAD family hydrolase [Bacillota bacterium]